ncbi:MAG: hypothetical protein HXX17_03260 [Geobacteraceae bacterium]|nr:hypothetical protein [Geobacteraceae bacterium]
MKFGNFTSATVAVGQADLTSGRPNRGGSAAANTLSGPYGDPVVHNGVLYLPDFDNNRVLGFTTVPKVSGASADFVLGQPDFTSIASGNGANQLYGPQTVRYYNGKLFLSDYNNSRILIWNTPPTTTQAPADIVVGQTGFGADSPATSQSRLNYPESILVVNGKLIVADSGNNRVLIWNSIPAASGAPADLVLGQGDFTHNAANDDDQNGSADAAPTARTMQYPSGIWSDGTRLVVCDSDNNRVLIWNTFPTTSFQSADRVLGQRDFAHNAPNDDNQDGASDATPSARTLYFPYFVDSNGLQLFLSDYSNNRVLVWNTFPITNFQSADRVLGQGDFTHNAYNDDNQDGIPNANLTARTLSSPTGIYLYGNKLFVGEASNHRYLIFEAQ